MTPLPAILLYHLGKCALRAQPGSHPESQTEGNSLSSYASTSTNPRRSGEVDSRKASLVAVPFLCYRLHVGREKQWLAPPYKKHLLGSQCHPWQLGRVYDKMATAAHGFMFSKGPWQNLVILQMPYRLIALKLHLYRSNMLNFGPKCRVTFISYNSCVFAFFGSHHYLMIEDTFTMELTGRIFVF